MTNSTWQLNTEWLSDWVTRTDTYWYVMTYTDVYWHVWLTDTFNPQCYCIYLRHPFPKLQLKTSTSLLLLTDANRLAKHFAKVIKDIDELTKIKMSSIPWMRHIRLVSWSWKADSVIPSKVLILCKYISSCTSLSSFTM